MGALTAGGCPKCDFDGGRIFNFCSSCGRKVPSGVAVAKDEVVVGSRALRWAVVVLTLFVPVVGMVMGARLAGDPRLPQRALGRRFLGLGIAAALVEMGLVLAAVRS